MRRLAFGMACALRGGMNGFIVARKSFKGSKDADGSASNGSAKSAGRFQMKYLKYMALLGLLLIPASRANAQVRVGIGVGPVAVGVGPAPVCAYGYYPYAPYACAPYGYWGPDYFVNGIFIGAGPWSHGFYGHPFWGQIGRAHV